MSSLSKSHYPLLDWVRFLSAFLVVLCHARPDHWVAWNELSTGGYELVAQTFFLLIRPGRQAVVVFFVLSGYLVGGRLIQRVMAGTFSMKSYLLDRTTRILIPFFPALAITAICVFLVHRGFPADFFVQLVCNTAQLQGIACPPLEGNPSLWSLNYEVWFYTLGGLLAVFFSSINAGSKLPRDLQVSPSLAHVYLGHVKPGSSPNLLQRLLLRFPSRTTWLVYLQGTLLLAGFSALSLLESVYFFAWVIGAIAALRPVSIFSIQSVPAKFIGLFLGVGISQFGGHDTDGAHGGMLYILGTLIVSVFTATLLPWFVSFRQAPTIGQTLLSFGPSLAAFSYTLYLTHYPLLYWMRTWHHPYATFSPISLLAYLLKISVCLLVAWLMYLPFERNTSVVRRWLAAAVAP